jgi:hypothetical protein
MSTLFIYCAGGYGKEVIEVARRLNQVKHSWNAIHFLDDVCEEPVRHDAQVFRFEDACAAIERDGGEVVIASGEPAVRIMLRDKLEARGLRLGTLIDATAIASPKIWPLGSSSRNSRRYRAMRSSDATSR